VAASNCGCVSLLFHAAEIEPRNGGTGEKFLGMAMLAKEI
jgi:hypothetical protein